MLWADWWLCMNRTYIRVEEKVSGIVVSRLYRTKVGCIFRLLLRLSKEEESESIIWTFCTNPWYYSNLVMVLLPFVSTLISWRFYFLIHYFPCLLLRQKQTGCSTQWPLLCTLACVWYSDPVQPSDRQKTEVPSCISVLSIAVNLHFLPSFVQECPIRYHERN